MKSRRQLRREWVLKRLGAAHCGLCGRVTSQLELWAVPGAFARRFGVQTDQRFYATRMCSPCADKGQKWHQAEIDAERREWKYKMEQREIEHHFRMQEASTTRPDYAQACIDMQDEVREALTGWDIGTPL